ncbi:hypothetical protein DL89DRAFT_269425 [Linderina pennispora]|uniref:Uncharacterized protein n=1 Tax=Linderina pennispora TaxID=61395 RepID=A0A1Y1W2A5_9FUNG|nr:uncharacterized protein DL89DRAFT_269425 [Linderina pennispora]ORX67659.1 hypothetical protein DL89DRAFT_269425 [Linderina pennispora]
MPIPSITLAPIILCAGAISYKMGEDSAERSVRRREEMSSSFDFGTGQQGDTRQSFVPTSQLTRSEQSSAASSIGLSDEHRSGYPRTTSEIEGSGWLNRTAHQAQTSLSYEANRMRGSRAPLSETKGWVPETQSSKSAPSSDSSSTGGGWFWERGASATDEPSSKRTIASSKETAKDIGSGRRLALKAKTNSATNGARDWFHSTRDTAGQAVNKASRTTKDSVDSAKKAADEAASKASGWFWGKKADADKAAQDTRDSVKNAADDASGWFRGKKAEADRAMQDTKATVKEKADTAADAVNDTADDAKSWFWNTKADADKAAQDTRDSVKETMSSATDSIRGTADDASGWLWGKKTEADQATANAADAVKDQANSAQAAVGDAASKTSGWFWDKKADADKVVQDARNSVETAADTATATVKNAADDTGDWLSAKKTDAGRATQDAADSADEAKQAAEDTSSSRAANYNSFWNNSQRSEGPAHDGGASAGDLAASSRAFASASGFNATRASAGGHSRTTSDPGAWSGSSATHDMELPGGLSSSAIGGGRARRLSASDALSPTSLSGGTWTDTAEGGAGLSKPIARKDSLISSDKPAAAEGSRTDVLKDNSVLQALDSKFNEARSLLLQTTSDIKAAAIDAGEAASGRIRAVAEKVSLPTLGSSGATSATGGLSAANNSGRPQGIVTGDDSERPANHQYRFVEIESHIPVLSSKSD